MDATDVEAAGEHFKYGAAFAGAVLGAAYCAFTNQNGAAGFVFGVFIAGPLAGFVVGEGVGVFGFAIIEKLPAWVLGGYPRH